MFFPYESVLGCYQKHTWNSADQGVWNAAQTVFYTLRNNWTVYTDVKNIPVEKIQSALISGCVNEDGGRGDRLLP